MKTIEVGGWYIELSSPHPVWVTIAHKDARPAMHDYEEGTKGAAIYGMSHRDLLDLQYAVNKAVGLAREALGSSATELT